MISEDNMKFIRFLIMKIFIIDEILFRDKKVFDNDYFMFILDILKLDEHPPVKGYFFYKLLIIINRLFY